MNKKQLIIESIKTAMDRAEDSYVRTELEFAACVAKAEVWTQFNPRDGVGSFSTNPYNPETRKKNKIEAKEKYLALKDAYNYAVSIFLED